MFEIKHYEKRFESAVMDIIRAEGEDWSCYWSNENAGKYKQALESSITYVALQDGKICGYSRSLPDTLYVYVFDLLVAPAYRGNKLGKKLVECLAEDYPGFPVYILSGNDEYYLKQGYSREGSVFMTNSNAISLARK